jgi:S1-C subfamily serine protease
LGLTTFLFASAIGAPTSGVAAGPEPLITFVSELDGLGSLRSRLESDRRALEAAYAALHPQLADIERRARDAAARARRTVAEIEDVRHSLNVEDWGDGRYLLRDRDAGTRFDGIFVYEDGTEYIGPMVLQGDTAVSDGFGFESFTDTERYHGGFRANELHGLGIYEIRGPDYWADFLGIWDDGVAGRLGIVVEYSGARLVPQAIFRGEFPNDSNALTGIGMRMEPDGARFVGRLQDSLLGLGTYTYADGDIEFCQHFDGRCTGWGLVGTGDAISLAYFDGTSVVFDSPLEGQALDSEGRATLAEIQRMLSDLGLYAGRTDGLYGPTTRAGLRRFLERTGLSGSDDLGAMFEAMAGDLGTALPPPIPDRPSPPAAEPEPDRGAGEEVAVYTGTAFVVDPSGVLVTNQHVVEGCGDVSLPIGRGTVTAADAEIDLALVKVGRSFDRSLPLPTGPAARTGADILVYGYPLSDILSTDLKVSTGVVSAIRGLGDDPTVFQMTAPIQPGNSGGPVIDRFGMLVGVAVASLDAAELLRESDTIMQNVNFGIHGTVLRRFLDRHGVRYVERTRGTELSSLSITQAVSDLVFPVECEPGG